MFPHDIWHILLHEMDVYQLSKFRRVSRQIKKFAEAEFVCRGSTFTRHSRIQQFIHDKLAPEEIPHPVKGSILYGVFPDRMIFKGAEDITIVTSDNRATFKTSYIFIGAGLVAIWDGKSLAVNSKGIEMDPIPRNLYHVGLDEFSEYLPQEYYFYDGGWKTRGLSGERIFDKGEPVYIRGRYARFNGLSNKICNLRFCPRLEGGYAAGNIGAVTKTSAFYAGNILTKEEEIFICSDYAAKNCTDVIKIWRF